MNNIHVAWRWTDGKDSVTATWLSGGWHNQTCPGDGQKTCRLPAEWKVTRRSPQAMTSSYYCGRDLPSTEAPPVDAEEIK